MKLTGSLVAACKLVVGAGGFQFPDEGSNLGFLHWEHRVLATKPRSPALGAQSLSHWTTQWLPSWRENEEVQSLLRIPWCTRDCGVLVMQTSDLL